MENIKMKNKIKILVSAGMFVLALIVVFIAFKAFSEEDSWIKNEKGLYIKHGSPVTVPAEVKEQQEAIECAGELYASESLKNAVFNSQCLGKCEFGSGYAVDIVHVPRTNEDNIAENQCSDYKSGKVKHFIELNAKGEIVRVV